ncbi:MAG: DUF4126 domain-containing protein [Gemmatimonadetes bacterium]|nr:DUF4126 domain-containing protein [Gemmatimonadota bacterium]
MDTVLGILLGVGLAAACGFRIFVPFMVLSVAAQSGHLPLAEGFQWIGTPVALVAFALATVLEVAAYFIPWVDNLLDALTTPVTIVAGMVATAAVVTDLPPMLQWTVAMIAGGGVAGIVQGGSAATRLVSSATTGGFGNFAVSAAELVGAVVTSIAAVFAPLLGGLLAIALVLFVLSRWRKRRTAA